MSTTKEPIPSTEPSTDPMLVRVNQAANTNDKPLTIAVVDQTHDVEAAAKDYAEARLRGESEAAREAGRIKGFLHRIWRGENGIATKYFFNKYVEEAKQRAEEEGLTALYTDSVELRNAAMGATIARFTSEYDESIHEVAGERRQELAEDSPFGLAVKKLIENYVEGDSKDWSEEAFREAQSRIVRQLDQYGDGDDLIGEGKVRIDNIWQIAQAVKESVNHGESLDNVLQGMKIYTGESRSGVRTEAHQSKIDKTIERLQKSKIGSLVGPETISLGAAIATGIFRVGRGSLMRAAGVTGVPGLLGGVFAGMRENKRLKEERAIHAREVAQGQEFEDKGRRAEIEKTRYETVAAKELIGSLEEFIDKEDLSPEELQQCYESIVNAASRIHVSDKLQADFISYSSVTEVESERLELDVAIARAKVKLEGRLGDLPEALVADLGIDKDGTVDDAIYKSTDVLYSLMDDRSKKDEAFKKLKRRRVAIAAATGAVTGFTIGLASQEALAFFDSGYDGLLENVLTGEGGGDRQTLLAGIFHGEGYGYNTETIVSAGDYTSYDVGGSQGSINLPDNYQLTYNPDGTTNIIDPNGNVFAENVSFEADGSLSQASQELLQEKGAVVEDFSAVVNSQESIVQDLSVDEYLEHHQSKLTNITRDFWYDNDTASVFDNNELGLQWGSQGDDGSIRLSISNMTDYGSYHGFDSVSWSDEAQGGTLKFAVSASIDSQDRVFMVDIAPDGSIDIPSDSPAANLFSVDEYGQVEFNGAYGEVVAIQDVDTDGITHVTPLATMEGNNSVSTISTTVEVLTDKNVPKFQITPPPIELVANATPTVEGFGGPAVVLRRPLENIARRRPGYYNQYRNGYTEQRESQLEDISPRLRSDRNANLELGEETTRYKQWLAGTRGPEYVSQIEQGINNSKELQQAPGDVDFVVTIPVAAASESENIYNTLGLLARQDSDDIEKSLILLNVNWLDEARSDPEKAANILRTMAEIDRARKDFPHLRIATIEREYNRESVEKTGGVIGYVAQDLQSAALLWLQQQIENGKRSPSQDAIIQRYDADIRGMSKHAWRDIRRAFSKYPETDIFKGVTRFGTDQYEKYPGFGLVMDMETNISAISAIEGAVHTGGANFGARASTVAAVNGIGDVRAYSGAGSDDVKIGTRIDTARAGRFTDDSNGGYYNYNGNVSVNVNRRVGRLIGGSTVDTDAERFISRYMDGKFWQGVWSNESGSGAFSDGAGGYSPRTSGSHNRQNRSDKLSAKMIKVLELNMSEELAIAGPEARHRLLSILFKDAPGAYTLEDADDGKVKFKFTKAGRKYIKRYLKSFGRRKHDQLYGNPYKDSRGHRHGSGALISA
jgi:hypothetical protein